IMFLYGSISYIFLKRKVRASLIEEDDIYIADEISSPFILGIINPIIYLPSGLENDIRENVLLHEKEHLRRKDHLWKPLGFILLSVYWFNPLLWLAYILLCRDIEGACDEAVITKMNKEEILSYSNALLTCATYRRMISACPLAFGETDVKGRVKGVLNYKKPAFWISGVAILTCLIVSVSLLTNPSAISLTKINNDIKEIKTASFKYDDQLIKIDDSEFERLIKVLDDIKLNKKTVSGNISDELSICINDEINIYIDELNKLISINDKENVYQVNNPDSIENLINFMLRVANSYTGANETDSGVICPAVMIKGTVYYNTGYKAYITCGTMDGYIESECPINMLPSKDNQSNFGKDIGYQVGPVEGTYVVDYLGSYQIFATAEVKKTYRPTFEVKTEPGTSRAEVVLTGWVYEIYENALGIENSNGRYIVSLNNLYVGPEYFNLTDEVEIHFDGNVAESWPMQISNVYGIVVKTVPMKEK
ncbi:MAG: M56 family metallopeptidase, partial [Erysipelotrichaceae bacterium]|nr:M56 family metallopeptidase [Erysipelotrichaceae bacterium]